MKKDAVKDIQEIIEFLLRTRERQLLENEENSHLINSFPDNDYDLAKENNDTMERFDERLITLNNLLKKEQQNKDVLDIEADMRKIQAKKYINTKQFEEIYNISISSQRDFRGRLEDALPYHQKKFRGTITYIVEEVEKWLNNQNIRGNKGQYATFKSV